MNAYQSIIEEYKITSLQNLKKVFDDQISSEWVYWYKKDSLGMSGDITEQNFYDYTFIYDYTGNPRNNGIEACAVPDGRVVAAYGISNSNVNHGNRSYMKKTRGKKGIYDCYSGKYDRGHFIAHLSGGPVDINLFPQRRDLNRGWSAEGVRYRDMEKFVAANPGIFVFSVPIYKDFSSRPTELQFGYCDHNLQFAVEKFTNVYH